MTGRDRLTVLHVVANRWWTGSAEPVLRLVLGLRARGHRVLLALAAGDRFEAKAREAGVEPVDGLRLDVKSGLGAIVSDARRLSALVTREGVDVVHAHHSHDHWLGWWGHGTAALIRTFHNERAVRPAWPDSALYRRTDAVVAVSRRIEERLRQARVPGGRLHRADGVVDVARFVTDAPGAAKIREEFGVVGAPLVGCVARLAAGRGHETLIEGFGLLSRALDGARLLLVGKGERRDALEALVKRLGLERRVFFAGYRDADLPAVLGALDVFVLLGAGSDDSCRAALEAILLELARLRDTPIPAAELAKSKAYLSGGLELRMEETRHLASWVGGQEALHDRVLTLDEALAAVEAVTAEEVHRLASTLIRDDLLRMAVVAPARYLRGLEARLRLPA